jgi:hypothetical protein
MKKIFSILFSWAILFSTGGSPTFPGGIGDPGSTSMNGEWALGPEASGVGPEISDRDSVRYDSEFWRLLLKGS